jgi:hypothetical protein
VVGRRVADIHIIDDGISGRRRRTTSQSCNMSVYVYRGTQRLPLRESETEAPILFTYMCVPAGLCRSDLGSHKPELQQPLISWPQNFQSCGDCVLSGLGWSSLRAFALSARHIWVRDGEPQHFGKTDCSRGIVHA